jgi:PEP-CTERM motif-containing protein
MNRLFIFLLVTICLYPAAAQAGFTDLGPYFSFTYGDGSPPDGVPNSVGQQTSPDGQTTHLYGNFGPIDGAHWQFGFVLYWNGGYGGYEGPITAGDYFTNDVDFNVQATGGTVQWSFYARMFSQSGYDSASVYTDLMPVPESGHVTAHFQSSPFDVSSVDSYYEGYLHIEWNDYSPTDTLSLDIPAGSTIDTIYVPEPSALALMLFSLASFAGVAQRSHDRIAKPEKYRA